MAYYYLKAAIPWMSTLCLCFFLLGKSLAQETANISIFQSQPVYEEILLVDILETLRDQESVSFVYDEGLIQHMTISRAVNLNQTVPRILSEILPPLKLRFKEVDQTYIILPKKSRLQEGEQANLQKVEKRLPRNVSPPSTQSLTLARTETYVVNPELLLISGTVKNEEGEPLVGATVRVEGTTLGTLTNDEGEFSLEVDDGNQSLVVTYIGYKEQIIPIENRTAIDVVMLSNLTSLEEVVVVGYGTQVRREVTGAISSVKGEEISRLPVSSFDVALQGRAPGVIITPNSGQPGGAIDVNIRGIGTFGNNSPLFVIDGVPVFNSINQLSGGIQTNPLSNLDPNNIEAIEILKDASAAAIYGARAANGVVIITTKRGQAGRPRIRVNSYYGVQWFNDFIDMLDSQGFAEVSIEADQNAGFDPQPAFTDPAVLQTNTDWQDEFFDPAQIQDHNFTVSGGTPNSSYLFSAGYFNQGGVAPNNNFERYSFRINTDFQVTDWLKIGESVSISRADYQGGLPQANDRLQELLQSSPTLPLRDPNNLGGFAGPTAEQTGRVNRSNQVAELELRSVRNQIDRVLGNAFMEITFLEGLKYRGNFGIDAIFSDGRQFTPVFELGNRSNPLSSLDETSRREMIFLQEHTLSFDKSIGNHSFSILGGYSQQNSVFEFLNANIQDFPSNNLQQINAASGAPALSGDKAEWAIQSVLARVNYGFKDRYLLTANFRRDGSSRFGRNNRFGNFPSFSVGWRLNEEAFLQNLDAISELKLRFSWGEVGNQEIDNYASIATVDPVASYILGEGQSPAPGAAILGQGNPDLQWETTRQTDVGLDLALFDDRFLFVADYYIKETFDALLRLPIPVTTGIRRTNGSFVNAAEIRNRGFEFALTYLDQKGDWYYNLTANLSTIDNEVISLGGGAPIIVQRSSDPNIATTITEEGGEIGAFFGWVADGLFQSQEEIDQLNSASPTGVFQAPGTSPGDIRFRDLNGDGLIDSDDRQVIGSAFPDFFYGFNADLGYKNFDLSVFFQGVQGNDIYNLVQAGIQDLEGDNNMMAAVSDRWRPGNTDTSIPRAIRGDPNDNDRPSTRYLEDGSFLRLRNLTIGYTIPQNILQRIQIEGLRIYVTGQNLFTITDYSAYNPDVGVPAGPGDAERTLFRGVDFGTYPISKVFLGGIQLDF